MKLAHEDARRRLYEYPVAKRLEIKQECVIGGHYHEHKTELFVLVAGEGHMRSVHSVPMVIGREYVVEPGQWHEFHLAAGSVLICLATAPHDPADDHVEFRG